MNVKTHVPDEDMRAAEGRPLGWWGMSAAIDVTGCDLRKLRSKRTVRRFLRALAAEIGMKRYRWPIVRRFGKGPLRGVSGFQFIYTSSVTWHAGGDNDPRCFLDVFSCKEFDPDVAAAAATAWFGGTATVHPVIQRGGVSR